MKKLNYLKRSILILFLFSQKWSTHYLKVSSSGVPCNPCMESIIQKINFLKNENCIFFAFFKNLKKQISFKFIFRKFNFGKLVKIDFIFRFYLPFFFFS